jgi:hypothetical protein
MRYRSASLLSLSLVSVQISIELRRHPKSAWRNTAEDTWTLKLKHTSRRFEAKWNDDEAYHNNGLPSERKSSAKNNRSWQTIMDGIVSDAEGIDVPIFSKLRRSGKSRKVKSRRQLPPKSQIRRKTTKPTGNKVTQPFSHEPSILRELLSGNGRLPYAFKSSNNETMQVENSDQTFQEAAATPLSNAAPIMYDFAEHHTKTTTVDNKPDDQVDQQDKKPAESIINYGHDELMEPYALPLQQPEDDIWAQTDKGANALEDTNKSTIILEYNYNSDIWKGFHGLDNNRYGDRMSRVTTEQTDVADNSDEQKLTDTMFDYVIEDPTPREYDTEVVGSEEEEDKHGITDERQDEDGITDDRQDEYVFKDETQDDFEPTAEMKRIMNCFPRSRLLTTENNGYKLFDGVSE